MPYLGGAAVYLAFVVALGVTYSFSREVLALLLAGTMVVLLGLVDDIGAISPRAKFLGQGLAVLVLMKAGITIQIVWLPWYVSWPLTFVWLIGITNAINLVDIMDGLAAGVGLIVALSLLAVALVNGNHQIAILTATLAGALAGFLRYNFQPARIYLGDTGSLFIGLNLGALAMIGRYTEHNNIGVLVPLVILGVPIFDTLFVMYIRRRRGVSMFLGSPDHVALRLRRWRLSVRQTVLVSYATAALLGAAGVAVMLLDVRGALGVLGALGALGLGLRLVAEENRHGAVRVESAVGNGTLIIGGGLAGLSAGWHLGRAATLLEASSTVGGLCRSYRREGYTFDISGHLLHFRRPEIRRFVAARLPGALARHRRRAFVHFHGRLVHYPFQAHLFELPARVRDECLRGFFKAAGEKEAGAATPGDFEGWLRHHFGDGIVKHFLGPYNRKMWRVPLAAHRPGLGLVGGPRADAGAGPGGRAARGGSAAGVQPALLLPARGRDRRAGDGAGPGGHAAASRREGRRHRPARAGAPRRSPGAPGSSSSSSPRRRCPNCCG